MPYLCNVHDDGSTPARYVFMDTDTGAVMASCEGHAVPFLMGMTQVVAEDQGIDLLHPDGPPEATAAPEPGHRAPRGRQKAAPAPTDHPGGSADETDAQGTQTAAE